MTLEFDKVVAQVERMGRMLAHQGQLDAQRAATAWERLLALDDLDAIQQRVQLAEDREAHYRGAAPCGEPLNCAYPLPPTPPRATLIAGDGSQIYPDTHAAALYYLTNVGLFVYHHGLDALPEQITEPELVYAPTEVQDKRGQLISSDVINARRTVLELEVLAREVYHRSEDPCPTLAITDGPLPFWVVKGAPEGRKLEQRYLNALGMAYDAHLAMRQLDPPQFASLIGYVDRPTSSFLVGLLHLMSLDEDKVVRALLENHGDLQGLQDKYLMFKLLQPGERSALMVQQSDANRLFAQRDPRFEIAFFYLNVGQPGFNHFARVEMPMWVVQDAAALAAVHALAYDQCQMMWRYPYALTRADEIAVVRAHEKAQLNELIEIELRRHEQTVAHSEKLDSKAVRHGRTRGARRTF